MQVSNQNQRILPTYIRDSNMNSIKDFVSFLGLGGVTELGWLKMI